jgi:hypothetical protein
LWRIPSLNVTTQHPGYLILLSYLALWLLLVAQRTHDCEERERGVLVFLL